MPVRDGDAAHACWFATPPGLDHSNSAVTGDALTNSRG